MKREKAIDEDVVDTAGRLEFYQRAKSTHLAPLWKVLAGLVTKQPNPKAIPHIWKYSDCRPFLLESCDLVSTTEAERRVLVLENPTLTGQSRISDSLFCGMQIILPGETAPVHRHTSGALRFIVEGSQAYTAVNGERTMMLPGDFVVTPAWRWHDHANIGDEPMVWIDGLDMHIVNLLNASFREETEDTQQAYSTPDDSSCIEFGHSMMPADHQQKDINSPIINYTYEKALMVLKSFERHRNIDPCLGYILKYLNPTNGDWAMPTMATQMRLLPAGFESETYKSTDTTVYIVVEGQGISQIGDRTLQWEAGDVFVAPSWFEQRHAATTQSTLFSYSDRAVQEKLGLWREQRAV
jgi:gentisate 1,2-dioxygenase